MPLVCNRCTIEPPSPGYKTCQGCRDRQKQQRAKRLANLTPEQEAARREKERKRSIRRYDRDPAAARELHRMERERERRRAMHAYGGRCVCCGEMEPLFLTLDHVDGQGNAHRRQLLGRAAGGAPFYLKLRALGYPPGLVVRCWNCHMAKDQFGRCPHLPTAVPAIGG